MIAQRESVLSNEPGKGSRLSLQRTTSRLTTGRFLWPAASTEDPGGARFDRMHSSFVVYAGRFSPGLRMKLRAKSALAAQSLFVFPRWITIEEGTTRRSYLPVVICYGLLLSIVCRESMVHELVSVWAVQKSSGCLELSGICHHPLRNSLFIADDQGGLCEISRDGELIASNILGGFDFEGITCDPESGLLYAAVEGEEAILEIFAGDMTILRRFEIPRTHNGEPVLRRGSGGLEGVTFIPDTTHPEGGIFVVSNQGEGPSDLNALFVVELPIRSQTNDVRIIRYSFPDPGPVTGLCYDSQSRGFIAVVAKERVLVHYDLKGEPTQQVRLPSGRYEGVAIDSDGSVYVADETVGIFKLR